MFSGKNNQSKWIGYFDKNIYHIDFPYPWKINKNNNLKNFFKNSLRKRDSKQILILKKKLLQFY